MDNININLSEFGGVIAALLIVGTIFKNAFPDFPNRFIPLLTWVLGMGAYLTLTNGWHDPKQWLAAIVAAATATGTHSAIKNTVQKEGGGGVESSKLPLVCLVGTLFLLTACKTPQLETGGAYNPATTNATGVVTSQPDMVYFMADAAFDTAYSTLDGAFKFERDNRALLWKLSPDIKHTLDRIRPTALEIATKYAAAREAYIANPTPGGLTTLQLWLSRIQKVSAMAQTLIAEKTQAAK